MRFKNYAGCCCEGFVRQPDYHYLVTLLRTPVSLLNFGTIESRCRSSHLHRPNSVKSYETNSLGAHLGSLYIPHDIHFTLSDITTKAILYAHSAESRSTLVLAAVESTAL
jgi:hypothetical protein